MIAKFIRKLLYTDIYVKYHVYCEPWYKHVFPKNMQIIHESYYPKNKDGHHILVRTIHRWLFWIFMTTNRRNPMLLDDY